MRPSSRRSRSETGAMAQALADRPPASRTRWTILALLLAISIVTYIDRVNISVAARQMMPALGLTDLQMGQVFSAFVLGYALFQIQGDGWATGGGRAGSSHSRSSGGPFSPR